MRAEIYDELSYWEKNTFLSGFDILIIGSGIVGLSAGIYLKKYAPSMRVLLLERGILPYGASTRNAGFACFGSLSELIDDESHLPESEILALIEKRYCGLQKLRNLLGDNQIDFQQNGGYEIFTEKENASLEVCLQKLQKYNHLIRPITRQSETFRVLSDNQIRPFGFGEVKNMIYNTEEGQIDSGKMMHALLRLAQSVGVEILSGVEIEKIEEESQSVKLFCKNKWVLEAPRVLIATNGFAKRLLPQLPVLPARNQVWLTEPIKNLTWKGTFHYQMGYFYFRNIENQVLVGGGRHLSKEAEATDLMGETLVIQTALASLLDTIICPQMKIKPAMKWSGIMGVGENKTPILGYYSDRIWLSVKMGGMGVAIGNQIGEDIALQIAGISNAQSANI